MISISASLSSSSLLSQIEGQPPPSRRRSTSPLVALVSSIGGNLEAYDKDVEDCEVYVHTPATKATCVALSLGTVGPLDALVASLGGNIDTHVEDSTEPEQDFEASRETCNNDEDAQAQQSELLGTAVPAVPVKIGLAEKLAFKLKGMFGIFHRRHVTPFEMPPYQGTSPSFSPTRKPATPIASAHAGKDHNPPIANISGTSSTSLLSTRPSPLQSKLSFPSTLSTQTATTVPSTVASLSSRSKLFSRRQGVPA
ncbi:hypothetical protein JCM11641_002441 [Rhodosporidiobolus odoratus]